MYVFCPKGTVRLQTMANEEDEMRAKLATPLTLLIACLLTGCGDKKGEPAEEQVDLSQSTDIFEVPAPAPAFGPPGTTVVVVVEGTEITVAEIDEYMKNAFIEEMLSKPPAEVYETRSKGLQEMVQKQIIEEAAAAQGLDAQQLFEQVVKHVHGITDLFHLILPSLLHLADLGFDFLLQGK